MGGRPLRRSCFVPPRAGTRARRLSSLCTVTRATLALLELYVLRRIGKAEFEQIATEFVKQDSHNLTTRTLQARLKAYRISV